MTYRFYSSAVFIITTLILSIGTFAIADTTYALELGDYSEEFYEKIQYRVEVKENQEVLDYVNTSSGLDSPIISAVIKGNLSAEELKKLRQFCGIEDSILSENDCIRDLKASINTEISLAELKTDMILATDAAALWANGTLKDSPFDLVVDLNILDIILFGTKAEIPLARWDTDESNKVEPIVGTSIPGSNGQTSTTTGDNNDDENEDETDGDEENSENNNQDDDNGSNSGNEQNGNGENNTSTTPLGVLQYLIETRENNLQCFDPQHFIIANFVPDSGSNNNGSNGSNNGGNTGNNSGDNDNDSSNGSGQDGDNDNNNGGEGTDDSYNTDGSPNTPDELDGVEECSDTLYGGFYCKKLDDPGNCDPKKGNCTNCFIDNDIIKFCIDFNYETSETSLFGSQWVEDSVLGYIESSSNMYRNLIGAGPLVPKKQQNQGGFLTHLYDLVRDPGKILYVEGKIPPLWSNEPSQIDFSAKQLQSDYRRFALASQEIVNPVDLSKDGETLLSVGANQAERQRINTLKQSTSLQALSSSNDLESLEVYYKNIAQNLENLKTVYEARFNQGFTESMKVIKASAENSCSTDQDS